MSDDLETTIRDAAQAPAKMTVDGMTVEAHDLGRLLEADRHLASRRAVRRAGLGVPLKKLVPPGTD